MPHSTSPTSTSPWYNRLQGLTRVGLLLGACIVVAFLLSHGIFRVVNVITRVEEVNAGNRVLEQQRDAALAQKKSNEQEIAWRNTPEGAEQSARKHGLVLPGEQRVNFIVEPDKGAAPAPAPAAPAAPLNPTETTGLYATIAGVLALLVIGLLLARRAQRRRARPAPGTLTPRSALRRRGEPMSEA